MKTKTKKITYLTAGLTGALVASTVVGTALSSCTVTASNDTNNGVTLPDSWYNKDINWNDQNSLNNLLIDDQGIVYSSKYMTEIIAILPGYGGGTITIPASVKSISGYYNVTTNADGTGTTKTAKGAFEGITSLTNIVFAGKNITQIGARAFYGCTSLQSINLPSSVSIVADNAFNGCASLNSINLGSVQYVGANAFNGAFTNVPYGSVSLDLNKTSFIGASAFVGATGLKSVDLSKNDSLASIGASAFANCSYLSGAINLSSNKYLVSIGASAFSGCSKITNIYLSSNTSLRTIGASAFSGCASLVSIGTNGTTSGFIIPSTVTSIGASAFANTLISKIDLSQNTATNPLSASAFKDMTALTSIDLGTNITTLPEDLFENTPKLSDFDLVLPASITSIASGNGTNVGASNYIASSYSTFYKSGFKSIDLSKISGQLIYVPYCMFQDATNLEKVVLKSTTTQIQFRAFSGCSALKTVVFADSQGNIPTSTGFVALANLSFIGSYAFYGSGLETIDLSAVTSNVMGTSSVSTTTTANIYRFANCVELTTVKLPTSTTTIPEYNFYNTPKLSSVNFNQLTNLTSMYSNNFSGAAFTEIDLSNTKLNSISTTSSTANFSGLSTEANVKLPATLLSVGSNNFTWLKPNTSGSGTTSTALPLSYPNGWGVSTTSFDSKILSASTSSSFSFLARISGALDFSNFASLNGIGRNTAFGSSTISSLDFSAKTFADGTIGTTGTSGSKNSYLGFVGTGITTANTSNSTTPSTYATGYLPFGNMSKLNTINFNNFTNATSTDSTTENTSVMAKTTSDTWDQVARIISSFGKSKVADDALTTTPANLSQWDVSTAIIAATTESAEGAVTSVELRKGSEVLATISDSSSTTPITFSLEGVTWTITVNTTAGTITITSSNDVDTYRAVVATSAGAYSNTYKAFFNTKSVTNTADDGTSTTTITPDSAITITLNVVAASTN